jgi:hypothetical protein
MTRRRVTRPGAALVTAMVILAVIVVMMSVVTRHVLNGRRAVERRRVNLQAEWLVRSGLVVGRVGALAEPSYQGGEYPLGPGMLVTVRRAGERLAVTARLPAHGSPGDIVLSREGPLHPR